MLSLNSWACGFSLDLTAWLAGLAWLLGATAVSAAQQAAKLHNTHNHSPAIAVEATTMPLVGHTAKGSVLLSKTVPVYVCTWVSLCTSQQRTAAWLRMFSRVFLLSTPLVKVQLGCSMLRLHGCGNKFPASLRWSDLLSSCHSQRLFEDFCQVGQLVAPSSKATLASQALSCKQRCYMLQDPPDHSL